METRIALFQKKEIRKTLHADEWWFGDGLHGDGDAGGRRHAGDGHGQLLAD